MIIEANTNAKNHASEKMHKLSHFLFVCFLLVVGDLASNCARIFAKLNPIPDITESLSRNFQVFESTPVERAHCTSGLKNACEIKMSWTKKVY